MKITTLNWSDARIFTHIRISKGNTKIGSIANISLPPKTTCRTKAPCNKKCYAKKAWKQYPDTRKAWRRNLRTYRKSPDLYFSLLDNWLRNNKPKLFRYHVGGDIPDIHYLYGMIELAHRHKDVKFLAFTKKYELFRGKRIPNNLSVVFSSWPGMKMPGTKRFPIAYMQNGAETRVKNAVECDRGCDTCVKCWELKELGKNVVFYEH